MEFIDFYIYREWNNDIVIVGLHHLGFIWWDINCCCISYMFCS